MPRRFQYVHSAWFQLYCIRVSNWEALWKECHGVFASAGVLANDPDRVDFWA